MAAGAIKAGSAFVEIMARDKKLRDSLEDSKKRMQDFVSRVAVIGAGAALAGAAVSIKAASDLEETLNKFNVVFGENREAMKAWGDEFAQQVGRSQRQVAEFLANTQDLLIPVGLDEQSATEMSKQITQLAVDVASFNNKLDADVLRDFHSALTGGGETVKKYGVVLDVAATKAKLLEAGIDPSTASNAQKVWARWQIILGATTAAQGDAVRSGDSYANQMKRLEAEIENLTGAVGSALLPMATELVQLLNAGVGPLAEWVGSNQELVTTMVAAAGAILGVVAALKAARIAMAAYAKTAVIVQTLSGPAGWLTLSAGLVAAAGAMKLVQSQMDEASESLQDAQKHVETLGRSLDDLEGKEIDMPVSDKMAALFEARRNALKQNTDQILDLMDKQKTGAEKLNESLALLNERSAILHRGRHMKIGLRDELGFDKIEELRKKLIDSATGFSDELQRVRDEIGLINGGLSETDIKLREMAEKGLPADQLEQLRTEYEALAAAQQKQKEEEELKKKRQQEFEEFDRQRTAKKESLQAEADQIRDALKTPAEKFSDMIDRMKEMIRAGVLDRGTANAFVKQHLAKQAMQEQQQAAAFNARNSTDLRTSQGASLIAQVLNGNQSHQQRLLQTNKNTERNTKRTADKVEELVGADV